MIELAADTSLFVLDDAAGLFFCESRQELYVFNAAATFAWCCLEEKLPLDALVAAYAETFAVPAEEAEPLLLRLLHEWQGLGYLSGLSPPRPGSIALTTALGRLFTSASLRRELARSPADVARRLGLAEEDQAVLRALDPAGVEAQVEALEQTQRRLRDRPTEARAGVALDSALGAGRDLLERAAAARRRSFAAPGRHVHYRLVRTSFCVRYPSEDVERTVHPALAHLAVEGAADVDCALALLDDEPGLLLVDGAVPIARCESRERVLPALRGVLQYVASQACPHFLQIHAGVLFDGEAATILPGAPGSGKTTLVAGAARAGLQYFSEELALLEEETLHVRPMPLFLTVKPGSVAPLAGLYPELAELPIHVREDAELVRYLPPPEEALRYDRERSYPVRRIVFPQYVPGVETALTPLSKAAALGRLMRECLVLPDLLDRRKVNDLARWLRGLACFELRMSDLARATDLLRRLA